MDKKTVNYIVIVFFVIILAWGIGNTARFNEYRGLCDTYREQLTAAEETNRVITDRLGRVAEITRRIKETTNTNITDARGIIETVERLRAEVKELEDCCGSFDQCEYYQYWDSYYGIEQIVIEEETE